MMNQRSLLMLASLSRCPGGLQKEAAQHNSKVVRLVGSKINLASCLEGVFGTQPLFPNLPSLTQSNTSTSNKPLSHTFPSYIDHDIWWLNGHFNDRNATADTVDVLRLTVNAMIQDIRGKKPLTAVGGKRSKMEKN